MPCRPAQVCWSTCNAQRDLHPNLLHECATNAGAWPSAHFARAYAVARTWPVRRARCAPQLQSGRRRGPAGESGWAVGAMLAGGKSSAAAPAVNQLGQVTAAAAQQTTPKQAPRPTSSQALSSWVVIVLKSGGQGRVRAGHLHTFQHSGVNTGELYAYPAGRHFKTIALECRAAHRSRGAAQQPRGAAARRRLWRWMSTR